LSNFCALFLCWNSKWFVSDSTVKIPFIKSVYLSWFAKYFMFDFGLKFFAVLFLYSKNVKKNRKICIICLLNIFCIYWIQQIFINIYRFFHICFSMLPPLGRFSKKLVFKSSLSLVLWAPFPGMAGGTFTQHFMTLPLYLLESILPIHFCIVEILGVQKKLMLEMGGNWQVDQLLHVILNSISLLLFFSAKISYSFVSILMFKYYFRLFEHVVQI